MSKRPRNLCRKRLEIFRKKALEKMSLYTILWLKVSAKTFVDVDLRSVACSYGFKRVWIKLFCVFLLFAL